MSNVLEHSQMTQTLPPTSPDVGQAFDSMFLSDVDRYLFAQSTHFHLYEKLGAHVVNGGVQFVVWAPNATSVAVVGDFNQWNDNAHPMQRQPNSGLWAVFVPNIGSNTAYKYAIIDAHGTSLPLKADPYGFYAELRPNTASKVFDIRQFVWTDADYLAQRAQQNPYTSPISIYEVHLGSWQRAEDGGFLSYDELAHRLVGYVKHMGFTHVEIMPVMEHPLDGSWGYQPIGMFAPTARFGTPDGFARLIDHAHANGIGVILDWVPAHFPIDAHGLAKFDGTPLYEHADKFRGFHPIWNTAIFDYGREEVAGFLINNALFWLEHYHLDGLRVDAVSSMLHLNFCREEGQWKPNQTGGIENIEAIALIQKLNQIMHERVPRALMIAEESSAHPMVSHGVDKGGLGFNFKWDLGFMHDTLDYFETDSLYRTHHHDKLTFNQMYAHSENYVLPLSHDEVVHGKSSLIHKMFGDNWQKFANLRAYYAWMWAYPGKKLLFMGQEFAQRAEWDEDKSLDWHLTQFSEHAGIQYLVRDLNTLYRTTPALHESDHTHDGFEWLIANDVQNSVFAWLRKGTTPNTIVLVVANLTPNPHAQYTIRVPKTGIWFERLNTDATVYGGTGMGNMGQALASTMVLPSPAPSESIAVDTTTEAPTTIETYRPTTTDTAVQLTVCLPPLATLIFEWSGQENT